MKLLPACLLAFILALPAAAFPAEVVEVTIKDYKFQPEQLKVKAGTTVKWVNSEKRTSHSIIFKQGNLPESERMFPGDSWQRTFYEPGVYPYTCGPHPEMHAVIEVVP